MSIKPEPQHYCPRFESTHDGVAWSNASPKPWLLGLDFSPFALRAPNQTVLVGISDRLLTDGGNDLGIPHTIEISTLNLGRVPAVNDARRQLDLGWYPRPHVFVDVLRHYYQESDASPFATEVVLRRATMLNHHAGNAVALLKITSEDQKIANCRLVLGGARAGNYYEPPFNPDEPWFRFTLMALGKAHGASESLAVNQG